MLGTISWTPLKEIHLGPVVLYPHGLLIAVGFVAGALLLRRYTRRRGIPDAVVWRILTWVAVGSLVGMRLAWVAGNWRMLSSPLEVFALWHGGMSLLGGIIGGTLAALPALRREDLPVLPMFDLAAPGLALGIVIGRFSDLVIGDHLGKPTGLPWGFRYTGGEVPGTAPAVGSVVHPVALYDMVSTGLLLLALAWLLQKPRAPGSAISLFVVWYGAFRLATDFLRTDPVRGFGMTGSQLTSLIAIVAVLAALLVRARREGARPRHGSLTAHSHDGPRLSGWLGNL
ncbi:MAG TPA: prolipoprotein diacylglyceryl transferase [Actinomycetota bacterium]